jgi:dihydropteroate synthase
VPISVDTYKSAVAAKALEYDVEIINDPSGLTFDVQLARIAANADAGLIINHMRGTPETWAKLPSLKNVIASIAQDLDAGIHRARRSGMDLERIVIDPGIGFGKRKEQNSEILAQLPVLAQLGRPILVGASRKQFLAQADEEGTEFATAAAVAASILRGAHIVRVHDVKAMAAAAQVADAILAAEPEPESTEREQPKRRPEGPPAPGGRPSQPQQSGPRPVRPATPRPPRPPRPSNQGR